MPYVTSGRSVNWTALGDDILNASRLTLHVRPLYDGAILAIMRHYRWKDAYYIYDSEDGQSFIEVSKPPDDVQIIIILCIKYNSFSTVDFITRHR